MKKIFYHICVGAMIIGLVSCSEESVGTLQESPLMTIVASIESDETTRATLEGDDQKGYLFLWDEGDQIKIYNPQDSQYHTYTLTGGAGTTVGVFTGDQLPAGDYIATYGSDFSYAQSNAVLSHTLQYTSSIEPKISMSAKVLVNSMTKETTMTTFRVAIGLLRMNLTGDGRLKKISIISVDKYISGKATLDANGMAQVKQNSSDAYKDIILDCANSEIILTPEVQTFYLAMPAGEYSNLTIRFENSLGDVTTKTLKSEKTITVERTKITQVSLAGLFTSGISKASINGSTVDVPWVQLWSAGPKFAEYNAGGSLTDKGRIYDRNNIPSWGSNWRLPDISEMWDGGLKDKCDRSRTTRNGIEGVLFTGRGMYAVNSIFLPKAGTYNPVTGVTTPSGSYWCTDPDETNYGLSRFNILSTGELGFARGTGGSEQRSVRFVRIN